VVFYEINVSEEPVSLGILGFDVRHRVVAQADVRLDGEFGLTSMQILGDNAVTVHAALTQTAGGWRWSSPHWRAIHDTWP
jgi:hypothetical protein